MIESFLYNKKSDFNLAFTSPFIGIDNGEFLNFVNPTVFLLSS
jgi:hypothetical protein